MFGNEFLSGKSKKLIASSLIGVSILAPGCNLSEDKPVDKSKITEARNESQMKLLLDPALSKIAKKAVHYTKSHPENSDIFDAGIDGTLINITPNNTYEINLSLKKGANTERIKSGDVSELDITKSKRDKYGELVRIEIPEGDSTNTFHEYISASAEGYDPKTKENELTWLISASPYDGYILNPNYNQSSQSLSPKEATKRVIISANHLLNQATNR